MTHPVTTLIAQAMERGDATVIVPAYLLPYDSSLPTFSYPPERDQDDEDWFVDDE